MSFERHDVSGARLDAILVEDLFVEAWLGATLRPTSAIEGLVTRLTLLILTVSSIDHTTDGEALSSPVFDYQHFVDIELRHVVRPARLFDWAHLERVEIQIIIVFEEFTRGQSIR